MAKVLFCEIERPMLMAILGRTRAVMMLEMRFTL